MFVHEKDVIARKVYTKCAKLVDEKNNRLHVLLCQCLDLEPKILIKVLHLTN